MNAFRLFIGRVSFLLRLTKRMRKLIFYIVKIIIVKFDNAAENFWEIKSYYFPQKISHGEMTAILRKMGDSGFARYIIAQKLGHFGDRNFIPNDRNFFIRSIKQHFPREEEKIIDCANQICQGQFNCLNSGVVNMRRFLRRKGSAIDWCKDPISKERYRNFFNHWRWNVFDMQPKRADIKGPWELTRCQHFVTLGQAYWLTGDEKYATCFAETIKDFVKCNPPGFGIHWICTMDVSLRIVGWLSGLTYFQGSRQLTYSWWKVFLKSLVAHGRFINNNFEFGTYYGRIIVSNHGLADLFGLYWLALNFPQLDAGSVWRGIAETGLEQQIQKQILPDGGPYEGSLPYHRLVVEMFLSAYALSVHHKLALSSVYQERLKLALMFIAACRQQSGRVAQIGDADNGRAHIFSHYYDWQPDSMDHLLVGGASVLNMPLLLSGINKIAFLEALSWPSQKEFFISNVSISEKSSEIKFFEKTGLAIIRAGDSHLTFANLNEGTEGIGNHKHCDQLAIEWCFEDQPFIVDAGSYTYTREPDARNMHRSTAIHNTLQINDEEQHVFNTDQLFQMQQQGRSEFSNLKCEQGKLGIIGRFSGYERLKNPVICERRILALVNGVIIIKDTIEAERLPTITWNLLLYPEINTLLEENCIVLTAPHSQVDICSEFISWQRKESWYSPSYGKRLKTTLLRGKLIDKVNAIVWMLKPKTGLDLNVEGAKKMINEFWNS